MTGQGYGSRESDAAKNQASSGGPADFENTTTKGASTTRLEELRKQAEAVRRELHRVEAAIAEEECRVQTPSTPSLWERVRQAATPATLREDHPTETLHHRPSYSLFAEVEENPTPVVASDDTSSAPPCLSHRRPSYSLLEGAEEQLAAADGNREALGRPCIQALEVTDYDAVLQKHPQLQVGPIGQYNHWDRRECAVNNPADWRDCCKRYMDDLGGCAEIPKFIHQIWIGPKEPPCLWLDTFKVDYLSAHADWGYKLWSDKEVSQLPMFLGEIYKEEKMWQCKADLLRLDVLWHHGGLYVDADMISVGNKDLGQILELGKKTGFVIAYEPDTKDKPYSILGNSVIACTPHHPLIWMLMLYLKQTYHQKRHHVEVFAVTGPVMYTKCLVDSGMNMSVAPQELLYPAFHYVPNPDAINFSNFPKCLMFQFGYTCSGLEGYVKSKNRCKKARSCPFHSKKVWPFGEFRELPTESEVQKQFLDVGKSSIPPTIHQLVLDGVDSSQDPLRWRQTWWEAFKSSHPHFQYKVWSRKELQGRKWFCANLYTEPFDEQAVTVLMLELLFDEGGYYIPLSSTYQSSPDQDPFFAALDTDFVVGCGGVYGAAKKSPGCFALLMKLYEQGHVSRLGSSLTPGPRITAMGIPDNIISHCYFPAGSKYLGAQQITAFAPGVGDARLETATITWAYECQVPCFIVKGSAATATELNEGAFEAYVEAYPKGIFVTDREFFEMPRLRLELPGMLDQMGAEGWDVMVLGAEWHTGADEVVLFQVPPGGRPQHCNVVGFVLNSSSASKVMPLIVSCFKSDHFEPTPLFDAGSSLSLWFGAEKYPGSIEETRIFRCMPTVERAFQQIAGHHPPVHYDGFEVHGNLLKGFQNGRLRFELIRDPNGGIMFRSWNDDNSTNCEMKSNGSCVEWMKVFYNHQVVFEGQNKPLT